MKLLGMVFILMGCTISGFVIDSWEKRRIQELENFIYVFEVLKRDIDYRLTPLREAVEAVLHFAKKGVKDVFENFALKIEDKMSLDVDEMWSEALEGQSDKLYLKKEDYLILQEFGKACGYLDQEMQERNIEMVIESLKGQARSAKTHYEKTTKLNKYLGFFVGACISIFLI